MCQYEDPTRKIRSAYRKSYDIVRKQIPFNHDALHQDCTRHCVLNDGPLLTLGKDDEGKIVPVMMAVSLFDMNMNMQSNSTAGKWL